MPDCEYCGASFDSEGAEVAHLREEHRDELGPIDRRRVEGTGGGMDVPTGPLALGLVLVAAAAVVGYVVLAGGGGGPSGEPYRDGTLWSVHHHGTINATIDGEQLDFGRDEFQRAREHSAFHFESNTGYWHVHAQGVTLQYALSTVGINVTSDSVSYGGTTYRDDSPEWNVAVEVNGEPVDPSSYVLDTGVGEEAAARGEGPRIRVVASRA